MLTDYEHNRIIHNRGGWEKFLSIYPHCAPRIKNAYDMAHELYPPELQSVFQKLGLIDEKSNTIEEKKDFNSLGFDDMETVTEEKQTTYISPCDEEFDLF